MASAARRRRSAALGVERRHPAPVQPKIASSCGTVAPALAARVAAILRTPCAEPGTPAARQAILNSLLKVFFAIGWPRAPAMKAEIAARPGGQRLREHRQDRQVDSRVGLLGLERRYAITDMLPPEPHGITAAQAGIEQHVEPDPLPGADRPTGFIGGDVFLGPRPVTFLVLLRQSSHPLVGSVLTDLRLMRPTE